MHLQNLIEMAAKNIGSYGAMAEKLDKPQSRISEWKKGKGKPDASEIMRLAELAGLEPIGTLLEVEAGLDDRFGNIWQKQEAKKAAAMAADCASWKSSNIIDPTPEKRRKIAELCQGQ